MAAIDDRLFLGGNFSRLNNTPAVGLAVAGYPEITNVVWEAPSTLRINFWGCAGEVYTLQGAASPTQSTWSDLATTTGTASSVSFLHTTHAASAFFRVREE